MQTIPAIVHRFKELPVLFKSLIEGEKCFYNHQLLPAPKFGIF